jgi:aminoglycoside phosphotransferase family enzyme
LGNKENGKFVENSKIMNTAEKRTYILQRISKLNDVDFEQLYNEMLAVIQPNSPYKLSDEENTAIDQALDADESERRFTKSQIVAEAKLKYPNLNFK